MPPRLGTLTVVDASLDEVEAAVLEMDFPVTIWPISGNKVMEHRVFVYEQAQIHNRLAIVMGNEDKVTCVGIKKV